MGYQSAPCECIFCDPAAIGVALSSQEEPAAMVDAPRSIAVTAMRVRAFEL